MAGLKTALAVTYHDPKGRLVDQIGKCLPRLNELFESVAVRASPASSLDGLDSLRGAGGVVDASPGTEGGLLGRKRREAIELALCSDASLVLLCDFDRVLHWVATYPDELESTLAVSIENDMTVLGRSRRAWETHPRCMRETEAVVNQVFGSMTGRSWDVMVGARALSRRGAEEVVQNGANDRISVDVSWPLHALQHTDLAVAYFETEGLELETPDRITGTVASADEANDWCEAADEDPRQWIARAELMCLHLLAMKDYLPEKE